MDFDNLSFGYRQGRLYHTGEISNRLGRHNLGGSKVGVKFSFLLQKNLWKQYKISTFYFKFTEKNESAA